MDQEKAIQFLLDGAARHEEDIQKLKTMTEQLKMLTAQLAEHQVNLQSSVETTQEILRDLARETDRRFAEIDRRMAETDRKLKERFAETDERIRALVSSMGVFIAQNRPQQT